MKSFIRTAAVLLLCVMLTASSAACGKRGGSVSGTASDQSSSEETVKHKSKSVKEKASVIQPEKSFVVKAEDCFEAPYCAILYTSMECECKIEIDPAGTDAEWSIYVLDDKVTGSALDLGEAPLLTESGSVSVKKNQYVYVCCSVNNTNASSPATGSTVTVTGVGLSQ